MVKFTAVYFKDGKEVKKHLAVATNWKDVTWRQYCQIKQNTAPVFEDNLLRQIEILTEFTVEELRQMPHEFVQRLGTMIAFSYQMDDLLPYAIVPEKWKGFNIGGEKYGKVVTIKQQFRKMKDSGLDEFEITRVIVKQYCGYDVEQKPITEVLGICTFFLICFLPFLNDTITSGTGSTSRKNWRQVLRHLAKPMAISSQ